MRRTMKRERQTRILHEIKIDQERMWEKQYKTDI